MRTPALVSFKRRRRPGRFKQRQRLLLRPRRRGASTIETALVLSVLLTLVFGTLDLALAVRQHNAVSAAARQVTREAIVRGELSAPRKPPWGPSTFVGTAADNHEISQVVLPVMAGSEPDEVHIKVEWPDGSNANGMRVRCTVSTTYTPAVIRFAPLADIKLTSTSTMLISH